MSKSCLGNKEFSSREFLFEFLQFISLIIVDLSFYSALHTHSVRLNSATSITQSYNLTILLFNKYLAIIFILLVIASAIFNLYSYNNFNN